MFAIFNILIIVLVLLIAYWWANQGMFSALLHLLCVIAAGAIALALWEPLTAGLLLRGTKFDDYAWGVSFIVLFVLSLFLIRLAFDKFVGSNVQLPRWANLTFGLLFGAGAGVLTMGLFLIGAGHLQSSKEIMGFHGYGRSSNSARMDHINRMWIPIHEWTYEFYSLLSVGSLYPTFNGTPLRQYNPDLHLQASLLRDSAVQGRAKFSLAPDDATILDVMRSDDPQFPEVAVSVQFDAGARDFGEQMTISSAQVRLIGEATGTAEPPVAFPVSWSQYDGWHLFDDTTHYAISEPGQSQATVRFFFNTRDFKGKQPKFIQLRGTRFRLPAARIVARGELVQARGSAGAVTSTSVTIDRSAPSIQAAVSQSNSISPITASTNNKPSGIELSGKFIAGGDGDFHREGGGSRPSRNLMIEGVLEPTGTRVVQVNVSRESSANIFGAVADRAGPNAKIMLVDTYGRTYLPVGFIHEKPDNKVRVKVDYQHYLDTIDKLPTIPTAGGQTLRLLFVVTEGATVAGLKAGDVTVGTCNLLVRDPRGTAPSPPADAPQTAGGGGAQ